MRPSKDDILFQEMLEDVVSAYDDVLRVVEENESYCIITNVDKERSFIVAPNDKKHGMIIKEVVDGFEDTVYKEKEVPITNLASSLLNGTKDTLAPFNLHDLVSRFSLSLLGIFAQPILLLEEEYDKTVKNSYMKFFFLVRDEIRNIRFFIELSEHGGMCGSGWTTATFAGVDVIPINGEVDMEKAIYTPKEKIYIDIESSEDVVNFYIRDNLSPSTKNLLASVDFYGGDVYYPSGSINFNLPNKSYEKFFDFNKSFYEIVFNLDPICDVEKVNSLIYAYLYGYETSFDDDDDYYEDEGDEDYENEGEEDEDGEDDVLRYSSGVPIYKII